MKGSRIYIYVLLALVMAGCTDRSYQGMQEEEIYQDNSLPIPVKIHIGSAETIISKGLGGLLDAREWKGREFYVYAFNKDMFTSAETTSSEDRSRCLVDGSVDEPGSLGGKCALMSEKSNLVEWQGSEKSVYYPTASQSGVIYDFFAYYVDDAKVYDIYRGEETIELRLEIDGTQDIMSSKAKVMDEQLAGFQDEKDRIYMQHYCYSYYTAQHGIDPVFTFRHHLAKLDFTITPAYNSTGQKSVTVQSIEVESLYLAMFTVVSRHSEDAVGLLFDDENEDDDDGAGGYKRLSLKEEDKSKLSDTTYTVKTLLSAGDKVESIKVGGSMLVAPDKNYNVYIQLKEIEEDGKDITRSEPQLLPISVKGGFQAGNSYNVDIKVYGAMRVEADVSLVDWKEGDGVSIDDEDSFNAK